MEEPQTEVPEIVNPLVFKCTKCGAIVGDSFMFIKAQNEPSSVVLNGVTKAVRVGTKSQLGTDDSDADWYRSLD